MYLRPYLSEPRRQLIFVLSLDRCCVSGRDVLLYILPGTSLLMSSFPPIAGACCRCMSIFHIKSTRETVIPIVESFDWVWGIHWCCSSTTSTKQWGNLCSDLRYVAVLRRLRKCASSSSASSSTASSAISSTSAAALSTVSTALRELLSRWYVDLLWWSDR
jgi:hypothetical protein